MTEKERNVMIGRKFFSAFFFTLVELLIVISVIAILASFLLPALKSSVLVSRKISCLGNLKQISYATFQYIDDNNAEIPYYYSAGATWEWYFFNWQVERCLGGYLGVSGDYSSGKSKANQIPPIAKCPCGGADGTQNTIYYKTATNLLPNTSYSLNSWLVHRDTPGFQKFTMITNPSKRCLVIDSGKDGWNNTGTITHCVGATQRSTVSFRHGVSKGSASLLNTVFADGHANSISYANFPPGYGTSANDPEKFWREWNP